jgi:hypothetical protein
MVKSQLNFLPLIDVKNITVAESFKNGKNNSAVVLVLCKFLPD